mgnify:CR=1 FL=1
MKISTMVYLTSEIVPVDEVVVHMVIAAADSRHTVATAGDNELRKISPLVDGIDSR